MMELTDVLRGGRQCDEDGVEIIMSREACCVAADTIDRLRAEVASLKSERDQAVEGHRAAHQVSVECTKKLHLCEGSYSVLDAENEALTQQFASLKEEQAADRKANATIHASAANMRLVIAGRLKQIDELTQQLAAANGRVERMRDALKPFAALKVNCASEIVPNGYPSALPWREHVYAAKSALSDLPEADKEKS